MSRIFAIAKVTLQEAIRHRILYLLAVFALLLLLFSRFLSLLTIGQDAKIIKDLGLSAIGLFGLMVVLFVGVAIIFRDLERRTIQTALALPMARWEYVVGRYLGLATAVTLNGALMTAALFGLLLARGEFSSSLWIAVGMLWIELLFMTAVSVFFSALSTPIFAALFTAATYIVGHLAWSLPLLEKRIPDGAGHLILRVAYLLIPNLSYGDLRNEAVHELPIPLERIATAAGYELLYAALLLAGACLAFRRRDLL